MDLSAISASVATKFGWSSYTVRSASMEPTLHCAASVRCQSLTADRVLGNRWIYFVRPVQRQDVVVLNAERGWCGDGGLVVKRVIGIPGDLIRIVGRVVYVNGRLVAPKIADRDEFGPQSRVRDLRVSARHYFLVGDNTEIACDSRTHGTVPRRMIVGKVVLIWSPLRRMRFL
jgi:signal peptidase I